MEDHENSLGQQHTFNDITKIIHELLDGGCSSSIDRQVTAQIIVMSNVRHSVLEQVTNTLRGSLIEPYALCARGF
jgi:hypothetical protein